MTMYRFRLLIALLLLASVAFTASDTSAAPKLALPSPVSCPNCYKPPVGTKWQWQLTGTVDTTKNVQMYDIDLFDVPVSTVNTLHGRGIKVICYMSAGSWENWRPDAGQFPAFVKGRNNGWPGEKWLDIRQISILGPIMEARLDLCKSKGFDGVEFDNVDGFDNNTGFPLTAQDQLAYNVYLANEAHERGLSAALKNDIAQVKTLAPYFDYAVNEQCFQYSECNDGQNSLVTNFINQGKPVFNVEYKLAKSKFCPQANSWGFSSMKKNIDLDAWMNPCW
jgi:hypothetical protein